MKIVLDVDERVVPTTHELGTAAGQILDYYPNDGYYANAIAAAIQRALSNGTIFPVPTKPAIETDFPTCDEEDF